MNHPDARGRYQPYVLELSRGRTDLAVVAAMDAVIGASVWGGVECSSRFVSSNEIENQPTIARSVDFSSN